MAERRTAEVIEMRLNRRLTACLTTNFSHHLIITICDLAEDHLPNLICENSLSPCDEMPKFHNISWTTRSNFDVAIKNSEQPSIANKQKLNTEWKECIFLITLSDWLNYLKGPTPHVVSQAVTQTTGGILFWGAPQADSSPDRKFSQHLSVYTVQACEFGSARVPIVISYNQLSCCSHKREGVQERFV